MLDLERLAQQVPAFRVHRLDRYHAANERLEAALAVLANPETDWPAAARRADALAQQMLAARPFDAASPAARYAPGPRPTPVTVVATDGSQVFPDRHREPHCYLLNVSRIAFQYGTLEAPFIESVPTLGYEQAYVQEVLDAVERDPSADTVSALRDQLELDALLETARLARVLGRPLLALADGTLVRWMLRRLPNPAHADAFLAAYAKALAGFRTNDLPLASYISMPSSSEVVRLLQLAADADDEAFEGVTDRALFARHLAPGERSALFFSGSRVQGAYAAEDQTAFFYLHVPGAADEYGEPVVEGEVARVELPRWVAEQPEHVALVHAVLLSECLKHDGYPMILAEAHERAVIRAREKEAFYEMLDHDFRAAGVPVPLSRKAASKMAPRG